MNLQQQVDISIDTISHNEFLTISETLSILKINRTTLWRLQKKSIFTPIYIGKSIRYKKSEILTFLNNGGQKL